MCGQFSRITPDTCGWERRTVWICWIATPADSSTIVTTTATPARCATRSSCRSTRMRAGLVWIGTAPAASAAGIRAAGSSAATGPTGSAASSSPHSPMRPNDKVWIASLGGGLVQYDGDSGEATDIDTHRRPTQRARRSARDVAAAGSSRHAVDRHHGERTEEARGRRAARIDSGQAPAIRAVLSDAGIMTIFEARNGQLWIGTHDGGANVLDPATGLVRQLPYGASAPGAISAASVTAIAEDSKGNFWIGTDGGGLDLARPDGTVIKVFRHDPKDPGQPAREHGVCDRGRRRGPSLGRHRRRRPGAGGGHRRRCRIRSASR